MKLKLNDQVIVIAGKDKDKKGKIIRILRKNNKVVVEKINIRTKHIKKTSEKPGSKIQFEAPVDSSNVMVICPNCKKNTRVGYKKLETGKKQRICKKCSESLDKAKKEKK
ncbi:MAG: 50S ribosomal protein L24 [Candidatus Gracilibacteria bacterium]|jgi:large subunit ribosomal protein L24